MSDYTPTTDDVRMGWADLRAETVQEGLLAEAEFDRWLAQHDAEIQAQALRDAEDNWQGGEWADAPRRADRIQERLANGKHVGDWLRRRAARLTATTEEPT